MQGLLFWRRQWFGRQKRGGVADVLRFRLRGTDPGEECVSIVLIHAALKHDVGELLLSGFLIRAAGDDLQHLFVQAEITWLEIGAKLLGCASLSAPRPRATWLAVKLTSLPSAKLALARVLVPLR